MGRAVYGIACWAAVVLVGLSIVALAWDGPKPELAGKTFDGYVACPVCMALVLAGGVSGAGAVLLYVREISGSGSRTWSR